MNESFTTVEPVEVSKPQRPYHQNRHESEPRAPHFYTQDRGEPNPRPQRIHSTDRHEAGPRPRRFERRDSSRHEGPSEPRVRPHGVGHYVCGHLFNLVSNYGIVRIKCDITEPGSALENQTVMVRGREQFVKKMKTGATVLLRVTDIEGEGIEGTIDMPKLGMILTRCICGSALKRESNALRCSSTVCNRVDHTSIVSRIYGRLPLKQQLDPTPLVPRPRGRR